MQHPTRHVSPLRCVRRPTGTTIVCSAEHAPVHDKHDLAQLLLGVVVVVSGVEVRVHGHHHRRGRRGSALSIHRSSVWQRQRLHERVRAVRFGLRRDDDEVRPELHLRVVPEVNRRICRLAIDAKRRHNLWQVARCTGIRGEGAKTREQHGRPCSNAHHGHATATGSS